MHTHSHSLTHTLSHTHTHTHTQCLAPLPLSARRVWHRQGRGVRQSGRWRDLIISPLSNPPLLREIKSRQLPPPSPAVSMAKYLFTQLLFDRFSLPLSRHSPSEGSSPARTRVRQPVSLIIIQLSRPVIVLFLMIKITGNEWIEVRLLQ